MNHLSQIQNGIDYIEANLDYKIEINKIAKHVGISQWHFQRIFKALTNETLKTYIRSRRMANALDKLLNTDVRLIDIALSAGFESQESFTRAFKQAFKMTPHEYRRIGSKNLFLNKIQFDQNYIEHINQNLTLEPLIHVQEKMQLVGLKTCFYGVESEKNNIAEKLPPLWESFIERMHEIEHAVPGNAYGIIQQTRANTNELDYFAAVEVEQYKSLPKEMVEINIPTCSYAKFTHRGDAKNIDNTVNYIYASWLLKSNRQHTYGPDIETYGSEYQAFSDKSVMYYSIPIR